MQILCVCVLHFLAYIFPESCVSVGIFSNEPVCALCVALFVVSFSIKSVWFIRSEAKCKLSNQPTNKQTKGMLLLISIMSMCHFANNHFFSTANPHAYTHINKNLYIYMHNILFCRSDREPLKTFRVYLPFTRKYTFHAVNQCWVLIR